MGPGWAPFMFSFISPCQSVIMWYVHGKSLLALCFLYDLFLFFVSWALLSQDRNDFQSKLMDLHHTVLPNSCELCSKVRIKSLLILAPTGEHRQQLRNTVWMYLDYLTDFTLRLRRINMFMAKLFSHGWAFTACLPPDKYNTSPTRLHTVQFCCYIQ